MARKAKKVQTPEIVKPQTAAPAVEAAPAPKPSTQRLIVVKRSFDRWYVYFQGVAPKDNVGCGCKTAKSAMRYMHLLKARYGATISQNMYDRLAFEATKEA